MPDAPRWPWPDPKPARVCTPCGATSEAAHFYQGIRGRCAECWRAEVKARRAGLLDLVKPQPSQETPR